MTLREELIKAGIIKPAITKASAESPSTKKVKKPRDAFARVSLDDLLTPKRGSKGNKAKPKQAKTEPIAPNAPKRVFKPIICPLCGKRIASGALLQHKHDAHGESLYGEQTHRTAPLYEERATFVRGGSPGLKK